MNTAEQHDVVILQAMFFNFEKKKKKKKGLICQEYAMDDLDVLMKSDY